MVIIMIRFKNGLRGNLSVPTEEQITEPAYQTLPLTAFHKKDKKGNIVVEPDPTAAARGRNFDIENKK